MRHLMYTFTFLLLMAGSMPVMAQLSIGFRAAGNLSNVDVEIEDESDDEADNRLGIALGLVAEIGVSEMFAIQPELLFSQHGSQNSGNDSEDVFGQLWETEYEEKIRFNYIQLPILAKIKLGSEVFGFNIFAGPHVGMGIGKIAYESDYTITIDDVLFDEDNISEKNSWEDSNLKTFDFGVTGGVGISILAGPGTLGLDARYQLGLANISDDSEVTIKNKNIQIGLSYIFPLGM